jgi:TetR/AcrR family transcriptional repressor of nem operon
VVPVGTRSRTNETSTAERILDVSERLCKVAVTTPSAIADVAAELDLTKAALHYHFTGKAELALLSRYVMRFAEELALIDAKPVDAMSKLACYAELYLDVLQRQRMCLCGMLAAEFETLPEPMRAIVVRFFEDNETWLPEVLAQGRTERSLHFTGSTREGARFVLAALEGVMLVARPFGDVARFRKAVSSLFAGLGSQAPPHS